MKNMLNSQIIRAVKRPASSSEMDSFSVIQSISSEGFTFKWKAGRKSSTETTIATDRAALMNKVDQVAVIFE